MLPYLSLAIWVPIVAGLLVLAVHRDGDAAAARWLALVGALAGFAVTIPLYTRFALGTAEMQFVETIEWIPRFNVNYRARRRRNLTPPDPADRIHHRSGHQRGGVVDRNAGGAVQRGVPDHGRAHHRRIRGHRRGVVLLLLRSHVDTDVSHHRHLGRPRRVYATIKFFLYTFLGSVFMLVALIYMYVKAGDYSIASFQALPLTLVEQRCIFIAFFLAFAVKVPMWPVHTWLPDAHVEAPTGGSVILAAIMLKMGGYGFLRFNLPITPDASRQLDLSSWRCR